MLTNCSGIPSNPRLKSETWGSLFRGKDNESPVLSFCCCDHAVGHWPEGHADQRQQNWGEDVVPAGARHLSLAEDHIREQEFEGDPGDVCDGWRYAKLQVLNRDVGEAEALECCGEAIEMREFFDDPALAKFAVDALLEAGCESVGEEAVCDDEATAGVEKPMRFGEQLGLVRTVRVTTALECIDAVVAGAGQRGRLVVSLQDVDALTVDGGFVERVGLLDLPWDSGESVELRMREMAGKAAQRGTEATAEVEEPRLSDAIHVEAREDFAIHLLEHGFAVERIGAGAIEAEVHVEFRTPCRVVRTGFAVVLLEADLGFGSDGLGDSFIDCGNVGDDHFSPFVLRRLCSQWVTPAPR